jgi:asparagine N-glycosylation enzyme membrane subunit Stt3
MIFMLIARVTSALMGTGTVLVNYYTVRRLYNHRAGLISALLIASSYGLIYYAHNANIDGPLLFWTSLGLYSFVALLSTYETRYYVLFGLFMALAIGTKESIYALFLGFGLLLLWFHIRHELRSGASRHLLSALWHRKLLYGLLTFIVASILVFNLPFNWKGAAKHIEIHLDDKGSVTGSMTIREADSAIQGHAALVGEYLQHLLQTNGLPAFVLLAVGFLYGLWRYPARAWMLLIPLITYYIFYLRIHSTDHLRYILPVYLLLTWQAGMFAADWLGSTRLPRD